jgi:hypothetical protein
MSRKVNLQILPAEEVVSDTILLDLKEDTIFCSPSLYKIISEISDEEKVKSILSKCKVQTKECSVQSQLTASQIANAIWNSPVTSYSHSSTGFISTGSINTSIGFAPTNSNYTVGNSSSNNINSNSSNSKYGSYWKNVSKALNTQSINSYGKNTSISLLSENSSNTNNLSRFGNNVLNKLKNRINNIKRLSKTYNSKSN